jgi:hypothetical protein
MKTLAIATFVATVTFVPVHSQETLKTLYNGDPVSVTWDNTMSIPASDFESDVNVGDYIHILLSGKKRQNHIFSTNIISYTCFTKKGLSFEAM